MTTQKQIQFIFDEISQYYDFMNNLISFGTHYFIKYSALKKLNIKPNSTIVDLCCGTGDFVNLINNYYPNSKVIGIDFSQKMLKLAKLKNPTKDFIQADCTNLPFENEIFNYATIGFGLRNIQDRTKAINEIYRILTKGGKVLHIDFGKNNIFSKIFDIFVELFAKVFKKDKQSYEYLIKSKNKFPPPEILSKEFLQQGFSSVEIYYYMFGVIGVIIAEK